MTKHISITLGPQLLDFVETQVGEVVRAGLRLLEEHEAQLTALREALEVGKASGPAEPSAVVQQHHLWRARNT